MAKQIIWSPLARQRRSAILQFWIENNKSITYSTKLNYLFKEACRLVSDHPNIGKPTSDEKVRFK